MQLHTAIRKILKYQGEDYLLDAKMVNALADFNAFDEHPALKNVFRILLNDGRFDDLADEKKSVNPKSLAYLLSVKYGMDVNLISYVILSVLYGLGRTDVTPELIAPDTHREDPTPTPVPKKKPQTPQHNKTLDFSIDGVPLGGSPKKFYRELAQNGYELHRQDGEIKFAFGNYLIFDNCTIAAITSNFAIINIFGQDSLKELLSAFDFVTRRYKKIYGTPLYANTFRDKERIRHTHFEGDNGEIDIYAALNQEMHVSIVYSLGHVFNSTPGTDPALQDDDALVREAQMAYRKQQKVQPTRPPNYDDNNGCVGIFGVFIILALLYILFG